MRGILFRGKRKDNGEWVYGDLIKNLIYDGREKEIRIGDIYFEHNGDIHGTAVREVIPETVGQFTGLCDKNGNKIFEGDIVKVTTGLEGYKSTYHSTIHRVTYDVCNCGVAVFYPFDNSDMVEAEVIGNIYDNPELWRNCDYGI